MKNDYDKILNELKVLAEADGMPGLDKMILDMLDKEVPKKSAIRTRIDKELKEEIEDWVSYGGDGGDDEKPYYEWNQAQLKQIAQKEMMDIMAEAMEKVSDKLKRRIDSWDVNAGNMLFKHGNAILAKEYPTKDMNASMTKRFKKK